MVFSGGCLTEEKGERRVWFIFWLLVNEEPIRQLYSHFLLVSRSYGLSGDRYGVVTYLV